MHERPIIPLPAPPRERRYHWGVPLLGTRLFVALDARSACAASLAGGLSGRRLAGFARSPLPDGALVAAGSSGPLAAPDAVRDALRRALEALGAPAGSATLVLPDGLARLALLALPADADARDFARFRLANSLPWPASDTLFDALPVGGGRALAAAVRRGAVGACEQLVQSCGVDVEKVHLAPLLALEGLLRSQRRPAVHVVLGDEAASFAAAREGALEGFSSRRRDRAAGEAARLREQAEGVERSAGWTGEDAALLVSGSDAARLQRDAGASAGWPRAGAVLSWPGAEDAAWLAGATA
jgi:hypothetical protein